MIISVAVYGLLLSWLSHSTLAQDNRAVDPANHFLFPPLPGPQHSQDPTVFWGNINITYGEAQTQAFTWVSDMSSMSVTLQQEGNETSVQAREITS
jgi:hypothetical protein